MASVTQRIKDVTQPRGGYVNPKQFSIVQLEDGVELNPEESINPALVGMAVDYLTRFTMGSPAKWAFKISLMGADIIGEGALARKLLSKVKGLDDKSITSAVMLTGFDVCYRSSPLHYMPVDEIGPDRSTIENIRTMVNRSLSFWRKYGPIVKDGFVFPGGYTDIVDAGDGDFLTKDTLWDFKVAKGNPTKNHTLQLLMYYIMGLHSESRDLFKDIKRLGIFNPRQNKVYLLNISDISCDVIQEVSTKVIGYRSHS